MTTATLSKKEAAAELRFEWPLCYEAENFIGSHLENLQRKGGFKGVNRHTVSLIIAETDPRKQQGK